MRNDEIHAVPEAVRLQLARVLGAVRDVLSEDLVGVYLHGSAAMGCFNPARSDVDLLAVIERAMSAVEKQRVAKLLLQQSGKPYPLEISFLKLSDLTPWKHPTPYELH